jgi:hypothetical protein
VYNSFLRVCQHATSDDERKLAFDVFSKMVGSKNVRPNAVTYTLMLKVAKKAGKEQYADFINKVSPLLHSLFFSLSFLLSHFVLFCDSKKDTCGSKRQEF